MLPATHRGNALSELFTLGSEKILKGQILTTPLLSFPSGEVFETPLRRLAHGFLLFSFQPRQHP